MKSLKLIILIFLISFGCTSLPKEVGKSATITFFGSNASISAEVADTSFSRQLGLMYRDSLGNDSGMLFIFNEKKPLSFWMANTRVPLDIIFLDENKTIVDIQKMPLCKLQSQSDCPSYISGKPAIYAIEVNQNYTDLHKIKIGSKASWQIN
ncbi:MAG: DUF192 domain-containing protein [Candidatus Micrarchaeia archaeon]